MPLALKFIRRCDESELTALLCLLWASRLVKLGILIPVPRLHCVRGCKKQLYTGFVLLVNKCLHSQTIEGMTPLSQCSLRLYCAKLWSAFGPDKADVPYELALGTRHWRASVLNN